ncbi:glutathione S-transferase C-terminal domain-containing protein [Actinoplanes sp. LDG1-06]|uniref:Glutathione S-transferase C-terminal domain-containing protein n=1 Tax=Paractinoplanes ovalisporus TaxID=2810368 RepID=A0ABS2A9R1_9ACTN|nr:glutathione S-transferase C-terminal domain-containing protein [Actinoplanes ovalisporus]MBM2616576.1 glutathione S-transferase C-terminal domain-containing protein [Actinoplanes ovalisporus]
MPQLSARTHLAGPTDIATYGRYEIEPRVGFTGRITADGEFTARPFRYHIYGGWFCPWSQRVAITRELAGLHDIVTMSYVDNTRDARGWAFRERYGPDPVNGFTLLRQAYDATVDDYAGHIAVPTLWDRFTTRVVSNEATGIGIDLATRFRHLAGNPVDTYPEHLRGPIDELDRWLRPAVNEGVGAAAREPGHARTALLDAFELLDARLSRSDFLVGGVLTEADIRLWVTLVRYDVGPNALRTINPGLHVYPHLWRYARRLYAVPAFRDTTEFAAFTRPGAIRPDWH